MFSYCTNLRYINDLEKWNMSNVTNVGYMFNDLDPLILLSDIFNWNTSKVENMSNMFNLCRSLYHYQIYLTGILIRLKI